MFPSIVSTSTAERDDVADWLYRTTQCESNVTSVELSKTNFLPFFNGMSELALEQRTRLPEGLRQVYCCFGETVLQYAVVVSCRTKAGTVYLTFAVKRSSNFVQRNLLLPYHPISIHTKRFGLERDRESERSDVAFKPKWHAMHPSLLAR